MRRPLAVVAVSLATSSLWSGCLLDAGPYDSAAGGTGTTTTTPTTSMGASGGTGGSTGGTGGSTGGSTGGIPENCGNGQKDAGEDCDEGGGNSESGDCTPMCKTFTCGDGYTHTTGTMPFEECDEGDMNSDTGACTAECKMAVCGDKLVHAGMEDCDDGNMKDDDGCNNACHTTCGDRIVAGIEECEDGNTANGDGCRSDCRLEAVCGNGRVDPGEVCDGGADCTDSCHKINAAKTCGKAEVITPGAPDVKGVRVKILEGDTTMNQVPDADVLDPSCAPVHNVRLFSYTTGNQGSIVSMFTEADTVEGDPTFGETALWVYRDCLGKKAEEACSDEPGATYSKLDTGYLPPKTTLFIALGGHGGGDEGKFHLEIKEQPVKLFFGTVFDSDLAGMTPSDAGGDNHTWAYCAGDAGCGTNTTGSWSGGGLATALDSSGWNLNSETLRTPWVDTLDFAEVHVQFDLNFSQKGGGGTEYFELDHSTDGSNFSLIQTETMSSPAGGVRMHYDVTGSATFTSQYALQFLYSDAGGDGDYVRIDDLWLYGF